MLSQRRTPQDLACDEALIYNYLQDTWTIRDLPNSYAATNGPTTNGTSFDLNTDFLILTGQRQLSVLQTTEQRSYRLWCWSLIR